MERLWSLAKNLLTDKRRGMATVMIQVILFLKENRNLCNDSMVCQSIDNCQQKKNVNDIVTNHQLMSAIVTSNVVGLDDVELMDSPGRKRCIYKTLGGVSFYVCFDYFCNLESKERNGSFVIIGFGAGYIQKCQILNFAI